MRQRKPRRVRAEERHQHAFANARDDRQAIDFDAMQMFPRGKMLLILRGDDRHLMAARRQRPAQPFHINGQAGDVRTVVSERDENLHWTLSDDLTPRPPLLTTKTKSVVRRGGAERSVLLPSPEHIFSCSGEGPGVRLIRD